MRGQIKPLPPLTAPAARYYRLGVAVLPLGREPSDTTFRPGAVLPLDRHIATVVKTLLPGLPPLEKYSQKVRRSTTTQRERYYRPEAVLPLDLFAETGREHVGAPLLQGKGGGKKKCAHVLIPPKPFRRGPSFNSTAFLRLKTTKENRRIHHASKPPRDDESSCALSCII